MEFTIFNESLILYAVRNKITGKYVAFDQIVNRYTETNLNGGIVINYLKSAAEMVLKHQQNPDDFEIRKIKVVDIGPVS